MQKLIRCLALSMLAMGVSDKLRVECNTKLEGIRLYLLMLKLNIQWFLYMELLDFHAQEVTSRG